MNDLEREWKNLARSQAILCLQNIRTNEMLAERIWHNYQQYRSLKLNWDKEAQTSGEPWKKDLLAHWWKWEDQVEIEAPLLKDHESTDALLREKLADYDSLRFSDKLFLNQLYWFSESILNTPLQFEKLKVENDMIENIEISLNVAIGFVKTNDQNTRKLNEKTLYIFKDENGYYTPVLEAKREDFLLAENRVWKTSIQSPLLWIKK